MLWAALAGVGGLVLLALGLRLRHRRAIRALGAAVQAGLASPTSDDLAEAILRPLVGPFDPGAGLLALALLDPPRLAQVEGVSPVRLDGAGSVAARLAALSAPREVFLSRALEDRAVREAQLRPALAALQELGCAAVVPLATEGDVHGLLLLPPAPSLRRPSGRLSRALTDAGRRLGPPVAAAAALLRASSRDAALREEVARLQEQLTEERQRTSLALSPEDAQIVARSAVMGALTAQLARAAADDRAVLVVAERGAGGDRVARAVHLGSPRKDGPFVLVDGVGLDSEGALRSLSAARGGTLYVRDIPALPPDAQEALAQRCAAGEARLVGSSQVDPAQRDDHGGLADPLWELLRRGPLRVPSLRHRREDLGPLATSIVRRHARALGKRVDGLTHGALEAIQAYDWPGNVRELDAILAVAVSKAGGALLARGDLPEWLVSRAHHPADPA
jgi:hypothetical protein